MTSLSPDMIDGLLRAVLTTLDPKHPACISGQRIGGWFVHFGIMHTVVDEHVVCEDAREHLERIANG